MSEKTYKQIKMTTIAIFSVGMFMLSTVTAKSYLDTRKHVSQEKASQPQSVATTRQPRAGTTSVLGSTDTRQLAIMTANMQSDGMYFIEVTNVSSDKVEFSPGLQLFGVTADGMEHDVVSLDSTNPLVGGPLNPNQSSSGKLSFASSKNLTKIRLYQSADMTLFLDFPL